MYRVIAANLNKGAVVEKEDKLYWSYAPKFIKQTRERDLRPMRRTEIEQLVKVDKFVLYNPPIEVERLEDWPAAVEEANRTAKANS